MASWKRPYPFSMKLDGHVVPLEIARLGNTEYSTLKFGLMRSQIPSRGVPIRRPGEDQKNEKDEYLLSDEDVQSLRIYEMPEVEHLTYIRNLEHAAVAYAQLVDRSIRDYVRVPRPWTHPVDGIVISSVEDLLEFYGSRESVLASLLTEILKQNSLPTAVKNVLSSLAVSATGSVSEDENPTGTKPAETVLSAGS